jgi:hypothetical protein
MRKINPFRGMECVDARLKTVTDPRRRAVLTTVRDHLEAEAESDFDLLLTTLAPHPEYHFWVEGSGFGAGPKGLDEVKAHYENLYLENRHVCEWEIDRIVVDDDTVVTEGWFEQLFPGRVLETRGVEVDDPDAVYAVRVRLAIFWPFDADARLIGEDSYVNGAMFAPENIRKLQSDEVPEQFFART